MPAMNALLFGVIRVALMSSALVPGPDEAETRSGPVARVGQVAVKAADDDLEVARLMAGAPDDGAFGDPVIVDGDTGIASRISGFGFADK